MKRTVITAILCAFTFLAAHPALAQNDQYSIQFMTEEVKSALDARRARYDKLKNFKEQGVIGENNSGYVELLKDNAEAASLVKAENRDRKTLYTTIVEQNKIKEGLSIVEKVFAQVQRNKAESGEMVQDENGSWTKK